MSIHRYTPCLSITNDQVAKYAFSGGSVVGRGIQFIDISLNDDADKAGFDEFTESLGASFVETDPTTPVTMLNVTTPFSCPAGVAVNDAVYVSAPDTVDQATALDPAKAAIGFVTSKPTATTAIVSDNEEIQSFVGLVSGQSYFLDIVPGKIVPSAAPPSAALIQRIGYARNTTTLKAQIV
jgi:hypothetical protein